VASIGRASAMLASGTIVSRLLGFVKAALLAQTLGIAFSFSGDAYATATTVPNSLYAIIAQGILNAILVPQIVRASSHPDGGKAYINKLLTIGLLIFAAITVVGTVFAPLLMVLYGTKPPQSELATAFAYWSLPQIFFLGLYTLLGEVLNARKSFGPFTWAPVANNVVGITMLLIFIAVFGADSQGHRLVSDWTPPMIALLAGGATLGIAVQALLLFAFWRRVGLKFRPDFVWRGVNLGHAGKAAGWTFAMLIATQLGGLVQTNVSNSASGQGASTLTLTNAWLVFMLPHSIVTVSVVTAYYTRMAEHAHRGDMLSFRVDYSAAMRAISLIIVLASAVLIVVAYPFARIFASTFTGVEAMGNVLIAFLIGLVPYCILFITQRAFYALSDTRTPFLFTLVQVSIVIVGVLACFALPPVSRAAGIGVVVSVAGTVQALIAAILLRRRLGGIDAARILRSLSRYVAGGVVALVAGGLLLFALGGTRQGGFAVNGIIGSLVSMAVIGVVMSIVYLVVLRLLRSPELAEATATISRRLRRGSNG
jgi:putative peptidoglycan lipid II flippase